jgi:hypothetical protein
VRRAVVWVVVLEDPREPRPWPYSVHAWERDARRVAAGLVGQARYQGSGVRAHVSRAEIALEDSNGPAT